MSEAELRAMVREVLHEALAKGRAGTAPTRAAEAVRIGSDADLAAFLRRVIALLDDPATGPALRAGRIGFTLAGQGAPVASAPAPAAAGPAQVLGGTVTEAKIAKLVGVGAVVLAPGAVITPLARDRARAMGLKIERWR